MTEECGATTLDMIQSGVAFFEYDDTVDKNMLEVHVFKATKYVGDIIESDEMKPQWFNKNEIPFEQMWPGDKHWFEYMLQDQPFKAHFICTDYDTITQVIYS
jgi:hypothetical protein